MAAGDEFPCPYFAIHSVSVNTVCLQQDRHVYDEPHGHLQDFLSALIADAAARGEVCADVPPAELAAYRLNALNALGAGGPLSSKAAADRLVAVVMAGLAG
ncbi:MAG: hypothetical protein HOV87_13550 [Catenulispora sp.]|nr:hypothetical protein [Catenulispora sp.]